MDMWIFEAVQIGQVLVMVVIAVRITGQVLVVVVIAVRIKV